MVSPLDERYGGAAGLDTEDHTQRLHDMFTDANLRAPYEFTLPPCPNGVGWGVTMGEDFETFPIKAGGWSLAGGPEEACQLRRLGPVVARQKMFESRADSARDDVSFRSVRVDGRKYALYEESSWNGDIETINTFVRLIGAPENGLWNARFTFEDNVVVSWPGIVLDAHQLDGFSVRRNYLSDNHRGGLIFRYGARDGYCSSNTALRSGDDAIAFNGNSDQFWAEYGTSLIPPKAERVQIRYNTLSEKQGQDVPEPPSGRKRAGNSPIAIRGGNQITLVGNVIGATEDGHTDSDGNVWPAQSAVDVVNHQGQSAENIYIRDLRITRTKAPGLSVERGVSGSVAGGVIDEFLGGRAGCPWKLPKNFARRSLSPAKVCDA